MNQSVGSSRSGTPSQVTLPKSIPTYERSLYEKFGEMHNLLLTIKNDRNSFFNSKQICRIYDDFLNLLHELKLTRKDEELKGITLNLPNANDSIIDDIWQLVSLCFLTCGLTKYAPATYSSLSTVYKFLHHLREGQVYTLDDLKPIKQRLADIEQIVNSNQGDDDDDDDDMYPETSKIYSDPPAKTNIHKMEEQLILKVKLNKCQNLYNELEDNVKTIPAGLESTFNQLITIRKSILNYLTNANSQKGPELYRPQQDQEEIVAKINEFKQELKKIESKRETDVHEGKEGDKKLEASQAVLNGLLDDCNNLLNDLSIQNDTTHLSGLFESLLTFKDNKELIEINKGFESLYSRLIDLKYTLENLLITRRWTLRETDLYNYQKQLKSIDDERLKHNESIKNIQAVSGNSHETTAITQHFRKNQILILYLLRRCYSLIYKLLESSEPVSESLQPIHNQLSTVRKCLLEIKRIDGLNNLRELYPFQFKLASLDNLRRDGKFIVNNQIPEGQGTLNALLAECCDIMHELKIELEEKEDQEDTNGGNFTNSKVTNEDNDEELVSDDEVEIKRSRYVGFNEADYDQDSESAFDDEESSFSDSEYEGNDYY